MLILGGKAMENALEVEPGSTASEFLNARTLAFQFFEI